MLFIVITAVLHFGGNHIYHWLEPGIMTEGSANYDAIIAGKEPYLNATFFVIRSFIYVITLAHLLHLVGGLIALSVTTIKSKQGKYSKENYLGIGLTSIYWHFLGLLWLYLFLFKRKMSSPEQYRR